MNKVLAIPLGILVFLGSAVVLVVGKWVVGIVFGLWEAVGLLVIYSIMWVVYTLTHFAVP